MSDDYFFISIITVYIKKTKKKHTHCFLPYIYILLYNITYKNKIWMILY